jgi:uncharacterized membrane protein
MAKYIAPIIITIIIGFFIFLYGFGITAALRQAQVPLWVVFAAAVLIMSLMAALIYTLCKRIKEIKEEEKDDISKY